MHACSLSLRIGRLLGVSTRDIMTRDVHTADPNASVKDVVETHFTKYKHGGFPVEKDSRLVGLITLQDIRKIPREKWPETKVGDAITPCEKLKCKRIFNRIPSN